ncbi:MAG TPA: MOSC domain-containing protein [Thermomicrobiales bacterium]|nr:MOSC domain-containing protein [Thermomicrobiales bacterium]
MTAPRLLDSTASAPDTTTGRIDGIFITTAAGQPMIPLQSVHAIAGTGLEGDRYALGTGFYSDGSDGRELTLIEQEDLEQLAGKGVALAPHECRRNLVTSGVRLQPLVGTRFFVGEVECEGVRLCPPCNHLEELTRPGPLRGLARSGGLRARILTGGRIAVGDSVRQA